MSSLSHSSAPGAGPIGAVVLQAANSVAYLSAVFAAYRAGQVVLALPAGTALPELPGVTVLAQEAFTDSPGWFTEGFDPIRSDAPAQIAFSSGTTGRPKALLLSHRALSDVTDRINAAMGIDETIREYIGVPVTFSFGFGRARAVAAAGGRSYLPPHGFDPREIARMLEADEINAISAVPTLWRVVLANPDSIGPHGAKVRWIEIGSQYMSGPEKAAMKRLFPNARIVQHYGLTEASRSTLLDITASEGTALESVGRAEGAVEIAIAPDGAIRIRGPHVADGLITEEGLIPLTDAQGWLTTTDRGRIEDGFLFYEGRTDEVINVGGLKVDPTRFEQRLMSRLGIAEGLAVGRVPDALRGDCVLIVAVPGLAPDPASILQAARGVAEDLGLTGSGALVLRSVAAIPRTATGKVQRNLLADLPDLSPPAPGGGPSRLEPATAPADATAMARAETLRALWAEVLGVPSVSLTESFYDLGGDSLSALTVIIRMESLGIDPEIARGIFDGKTIAELAGIPLAAGADGAADRPPAAEQTTSLPALSLGEAMNAVNATRGVLILWVVVVHWLPGVLRRISEDALWLYDALNPVLRFGTPGFALVFGLGIGALGLPRYRRDPAQFLKSARFNLRLIAIGVLVFAFFRFLSISTRGDPINWDTLPSGMFYSAMSYYLLALLALPLIMRILTLGPNQILTIAATAVGCMVIHEILVATIAPLRPGGVLELMKILLTAKYGFFRMSIYVMVGVLIGHVFRTRHGDPNLPRDLAMAGAILFSLGFVLIWEIQPEAVFEGFGQVQPWHLVVYAGVALLILAGFSRIGRAGGAGVARPLQRMNAFFIASGILSFPIFVGHELVLPAKATLENIGVPSSVALAVTVGLFLGGITLAYRRLLKILAHP